MILDSERIPVEWRKSALVSNFKNKGGCAELQKLQMDTVDEPNNENLGKIIGGDIRTCEQQYSFMPRKRATDGVFALRMLVEKHGEGQKELHCGLVNLLCLTSIDNSVSHTIVL